MKIKHAFNNPEENKRIEDAIKGKEMTAITLLQINAREFVAATLKIKDNKVTEIELSYPDARSIAEASAKISFVDKLLEPEE